MRQTVTGSACNTTFQALFRAKLARQGEVKERVQRCVFYIYIYIYIYIYSSMKKKMKSRENGREDFSGVAWKMSEIQFSGWGGKIIPPARNVNENILESDFVPLCDGTTRCRSLADLRLLEAEPILDFWGPYAKRCVWGGGMNERMKRIWPSRIALAKSARETVSLPRLAMLSIRFFLWMRAATGSQCKDTKRGVTCALLGSLKTSRAAAFWIICRGLMEVQPEEHYSSPA